MKAAVEKMGEWRNTVKVLMSSLSNEMGSAVTLSSPATGSISGPTQLHV